MVTAAGDKAAAGRRVCVWRGNDGRLSRGVGAVFRCGRGRSGGAGALVRGGPSLWSSARRAGRGGPWGAVAEGGPQRRVVGCGGWSWAGRAGGGAAVAEAGQQRAGLCGAVPGRGRRRGCGVSWRGGRACRWWP